LSCRDQPQRPGRRPRPPVPGSQTGSQRRQASGHARRQRAMVCAARWPIRPRPATCSDGTDAPEKRKVGGSTPPLTTLMTSANAPSVVAFVLSVTFVVSFRSHLPQADDRLSAGDRHSQRSRERRVSSVRVVIADSRCSNRIRNRSQLGRAVPSPTVTEGCGRRSPRPPADYELGAEL